MNGWLELKLKSDDYDSIGGLVIGLLDHLPDEGETVNHGNLRLVVERVEKNRIEKIHLYILGQESEEKPEAQTEAS